MTGDHDKDVDKTDRTAPAAPGTGRAARLSPRLRKAMAAVLAGLVVLALLALLLELLVLKPRYDDAVAAKQARSDVVRVAQRFTVQVNNFDDRSVDQYQKNVAALLTTKFRDQFEKSMQDIVTQVKQAKMSSRGEVLASAVASVDQDSADVLVVSDADVKTVFDTRKRHFRWEVSLVKVGGRWLVDDFSPVE